MSDDTRSCTNCGRPLGAGATRCENCGATQPVGATPPPPPGQGPPTATAGAPGPGGPPPTRPGFFAALFDIRFNALVTPTIITVVYVIVMVVIALTYLVFVVAAFQDSTGTGILVMFIGGPLGALLYLIYARIFFEVIMAVFKITENSSRIVQLLEEDRRNR